MAKDIFEKEYVDERDKNNLEGLLEQFNLPPAVVKFVRENKRLVQAGIAVLIVAAVAWAMYDSYRDGRIEKSSAALAAARELDGQQLLDRLGEVERDYPGTDAALWAAIGAAQELLRSSKMEEAKAKFTAVRDDLSASSPLQPLISVAIAQAAEGSADYQEAAVEYGRLIDLEGYRDIGYLGSARVHELQGQKDQALAVYQRHLETIDPADSLQRLLVEEKIARLQGGQ